MAIGQGPRYLAGLLGHPGLRRVGRAADEVHVSAAQFNEEDDVQSLEPDGLHAEEVNGQHRAAVRAQELAPTHAAPRANGSEAGVPEPGPHGGCRHGEPKPLQLANDSLIAPARILPGQPQDQFAEFRVERWATGPLRICPTLGNQAPMPGQQRLRRDDQRRPPSARQQPARGREEETVGPRHPRSGLSPPEDGELVSEHDDLELFEVV